MIFDTIRLVGPSSAIDLPLLGAQPTDPYIVKDIEGLGPSEVDVSIKRTLNRGGVMQALRPRNKELDILIKLNPDYTQNQTPATLREQIYYMLAPVMNSRIKLQLIHEGGVLADIEGYLKRVIPNPFSKDPEVQVSMDCLQPYFLGNDSIGIAVTNTAFTEIALPALVGTAPTPFVFSVTLQATANTFRVKHKNFAGADETFYIPGTYASGSSIWVSSVPGAKAVVQSISGQSDVNLIGALGTNSRWLELYPGVNTLVFDSSVKLNWLYYSPRYQGV